MLWTIYFSATGSCGWSGINYTSIQTNERVELVVSQGGTSLFSIKGLKEGPTLLFDDHAPFADVVAAVEEELARANGFFRGSPIVLHFGDRFLQKEEWWHLKEALHREEVLLRYVVSNNAASRKMLYKEGLSVRRICRRPGRKKRIKTLFRPKDSGHHICATGCGADRKKFLMEM